MHITSAMSAHLQLIMRLARDQLRFGLFIELFGWL